jgi:hypothetical protein
MDSDERAIIEYLKSWPHSFVSGKEIARKACGKTRHADDVGWAVPILARLVQHNHIETDHLGYFKYKPLARKKNEQQRHVSPQILKILKSSGKSFESIAIDDDAEEK